MPFRDESVQYSTYIHVNQRIVTVEAVWCVNSKGCCITMSVSKMVTQVSVCVLFEVSHLHLSDHSFGKKNSLLNYAITQYLFIDDDGCLHILISSCDTALSIQA